MEYSRENAVRLLQTIESGMDNDAKALYEKYEYFHDASIRKIEIKIRKHGITDFVLRLWQDYIEPTSEIKLTFRNVTALDFKISPDKWLGEEIYFLYFDSQANGIRIRCSTDEYIQFTAIAQQIEIKEMRFQK